MDRRTDIIVLAAAILMEGTWLYCALSVIGFFALQNGSPLSPLVVFGLLLCGVLAIRLAEGLSGSTTVPAVIQLLVALATIYVAVAVSRIEERPPVDMLWGRHLVVGEYGTVAFVGTLLAVFSAAYVWRQAVALCAKAIQTSNLVAKLQKGIVAIAVALLVEHASGQNFRVFELTLPFVVASLAALAVSQMSPAGGWPRTIAASLIAVVGMGLGAGLLVGQAIQNSGGLLERGWSAVAGLFLSVIWIVLEPLIAGLVALLHWLKSFQDETDLDHRPTTQAERNLDWLRPEPGEPLMDTIVPIIQYPAMALLTMLLCWFLFRALRRPNENQSSQVLHEWEAIEGNTTADVAALLQMLLPEWMRQSQGGKPRWRYPRDRGTISDIFAIYFQMLDLAIARGMVFEPNQTPIERIPRLREVLPDLSVVDITLLFNAARYGSCPTEQEPITWLQQQLSQATDSTELRKPASPQQ